jgi:hypothetical protein
MKSERMQIGGRCLVAGAMLLGAAVTAAGWASMSAPAVAEESDVICQAGDVCRMVKTRLPLRALPRVSSNIYQEKDANGPVVESNVPAFIPLYVFERIDVSYADPIHPKGWFRVGKSREKAIGYMRAADALEWKSAVVVSYSHRGVGENERKPVIMFKDSGPLRDLVLDPKLSEKAQEYYRKITGRDVPPEVITREPDTYVDIKKKFYLLPVLESMDLTDQGIDDTHILQIAAAVPNQRAEAADLCTTERPDFADCIKKVGKVGDDELKIDVVYVIDLTGSMQPYVDAVKEAARNSARLFAQAVGSSDRIRFGFVGFRDNLDSDPENEFVVKNFTPELVSREKLVELIEKFGIAKAGGDLQEEVFHGVLEGLNSHWDNNSLKVLFLIGDASSHDVTHRFATTDKDARALRLLANEQDIKIGAVYIKNSKQAVDWQRGIEQFSALSMNAPPRPSFRTSEEDPTLIQNAILEATAEMVDHIKSLYKTTKGPAAAEINPFSDAFRVGLVEFIGKATEPPKDITAWVLDKDLTNLARRAFDIHVLCTRKDLDELTDALQKLIDAYETNKMTNEGFFKTLQAITTLRSLDGGEVSKATNLARTSLLPRWIDALPYKSEITSMRFSDFEEQSADKSQQLQAKLRSLVTTYRAIQERQESWVKLNEVMRYEDYVYPLLLDNLP